MTTTTVSFTTLLVARTSSPARPVRSMLAVPVYDAETVARLHAHLAEHRSPRGRPRLWSDAERSARRAAHSTAEYRRRRAVNLRERGDHTGAERMLVDAEQISTALQCGYRDRQHNLAPAGPDDIDESDVTPARN